MSYIESFDDIPTEAPNQIRSNAFMHVLAKLLELFYAATVFEVRVKEILPGWAMWLAMSLVDNALDISCSQIGFLVVCRSSRILRMAAASKVSLSFMPHCSERGLMSSKEEKDSSFPLSPPPCESLGDQKVPQAEEALCKEGPFV